MRTILCSLLLANPALANNFLVANYPSGFVSVPPPASVHWQLATPAGAHVDLMIPDVPPDPTGAQRAFRVTPANAAQFGVDFAAWQNAVNDPAYSRSLVTWGGVTKEEVPQRVGHIVIDRLSV